MPRSEALFLHDEFSLVIAGIPRDVVAADDTLRSAALLKLIIIGEAATHVGEELRQRHSNVPWRKVVGFRNIAVHQYFGIDWQVVTDAAFDDVPPLKTQIDHIIAAEFP